MSAVDVDTARQELARLATVDLNLLVSLQVLLAERSVTRAATRIGLTQSAMSHSLRRCRKLFNDELLTRVGPSLQLTPRGESLLGPLTELLTRVDQDILGNTRFNPQRAVRRFRVALASSTAVVLLPPLLRRLSAEAPGVTVHTLPLVESGTFRERPDVDLTLLPSNIASPLHRKRLFTDEFVVVSGRNGPTFDGGPTVSDLRRCPHVVCEVDGWTPPYLAMERQGLEWVVRGQVHDCLQLPMLLIRLNDCIAVVQKGLARQFADVGLIRTWPLPIEVPAWGVDMVWNPRGAHDPARAWFESRLVLAAAAEEDQPTGLLLA
ncbi:LysR family transcriptional regulator [Streptomyces sp. NPDC007162]|uniref:LysR family transcriptional regulator n=1 Tax=Streptomyces sp. NPDC007162 TaxID=3156917 RepID=UPI0033D32CD7